MKIMTFNVQHCLSYMENKIDFEIMAKAILDCEADIVGLNEMRSAGPDPEYTAQVEKLAELTGMKYFYFAEAVNFPGKGPYGNAILSKIPIISAKSIPIPVPTPKKYDGYYEPRCVLKAELEGGITVLITHFDLYPDAHESAAKTIVASLSDARCILMGDFNITPDNPLLAPIKAKMKDTAEAFEVPKLSFPSDAPNRKIDYIFVSQDIDVESADIPPITASDHRPHVAKVKLGL